MLVKIIKRSALVGHGILSSSKKQPSIPQNCQPEHWFGNVWPRTWTGSISSSSILCSKEMIEHPVKLSSSMLIQGVNVLGRAQSSSCLSLGVKQFGN